MLGKLKSVEKVFGKDMDGYKVATDTNTFEVLISNFQSCCEDWGYMSSEDDFNAFIGSELIEVKLTDTALKQKTLFDKINEDDYNSGDYGVQFVDFVTKNGVFQLAVYNGHNGYYGHAIKVKHNDEVLLDSGL